MSFRTLPGWMNGWMDGMDRLLYSAWSSEWIFRERKFLLFPEKISLNMCFDQFSMDAIIKSLKKFPAPDNWDSAQPSPRAVQLTQSIEILSLI